MATSDAPVASFIYAALIPKWIASMTQDEDVIINGNVDVCRRYQMSDIGYLQMEISEAQSELDYEPEIFIMDSIARTMPWNV